MHQGLFYPFVCPAEYQPVSRQKLLHVVRLLKTIVKKLVSNFSLLNTPHQPFPIKDHMQSAHLFQSNAAISHERNT